jgi:predicted amidophosphoribosyltransferase
LWSSLKKKKKCKFHTELESLKTRFSIVYGGYYQTALNSKSTNAFTERIHLFRKLKGNNEIINQMTDILNIRWKRISDKLDYKWIFSVPSTIQNLSDLTQNFAKKHNLQYINWNNLFQYNPIKSIKYSKSQAERRKLIKHKYLLKSEIEDDIINKLKYPGIILDDIFNSGMTMTQIIKPLEIIRKIPKIKGVVLARTRGKKIRFIKFP